jgi:hypothetical protein
MSGLEELYFIRMDTKFTDAGFAQLQGLKNLRKLEFFLNELGAGGARSLGPLPSLETIKGVEMKSDGLKALSCCRGLKCLHVRLGRLGPRWGGSPDDVTHLGALKGLEELGVAGRGLLDDDLGVFASFSGLKRLNVWTGELGERGWAAIGSLVGLESLSMTTGEVTEFALASVSKLRQLESLTISDARKGRLTKRGLNYLNQLTNLRRLELNMSGAMKPVTGEGVLSLAALKNLEYISLISVGVKGGDWAFLAELEGLEELWLNNCGVCLQNGLRYVKGLPNLKALDLQNVICTRGEGLAILDSLPNLGRVRLYGRVTDSALGRLPALPSVVLFTVKTDTVIPPETIARLESALPCVTNVTVYQPSRGGSPGGQPMAR